MGRLTEANYLSRRVKLVDALAGAATAHADAAFRHEMGDGTADTVKTAKDAISTLEDRIVGLDLAWKRTQQDTAADAAAAEVKAARKAHATISDLLGKRKDAGNAMQQAAVNLAATYRDYTELGRAIRDVAISQRARFSQDRLRNLRDVIDGEFNDVRNPLGRILSGGGLDMSGIAVKGYDTDPLQQRDLGAFVDWQNKRVAGHAYVLATEQAV